MTPETRSGSEGFFSAGPLGSKKPLLIAGAVFGLIGVAAVVGFVVYTFVIEGAGDVGLGQTPPLQLEAPPVSAVETPAVEPPVVGLDRVFTFRDVFMPLMQPLPDPAQVPTVPVAPDGAPAPGQAPEGTLILRNIVSIDGTTRAVLDFAGATHTLAAGEEIPGTPWRVQSVSSASVVMLYGDVHVSLAIGQGVVTPAK